MWNTYLTEVSIRNVAVRDTTVIKEFFFVHP